MEIDETQFDSSPNEMPESKIRALEQELSLGANMILLDAELQSIFENNERKAYDDRSRIVSLLEIKLRILNYVKVNRNQPNPQPSGNIPAEYHELANKYLKLFKKQNN